MAVVAHSPLAGAFQKGKVAADATIAAISAKHPLLKTAPQVMLRWAIQKGFCVIPGSGNPKHQVSNLEIYGAELSAEDMAQLDALKDHEGFFYQDMREAKASTNKDEA